MYCAYPSLVCARKLRRSNGSIFNFSVADFSPGWCRHDKLKWVFFLVGSPILQFVITWCVVSLRLVFFKTNLIPTSLIHSFWSHPTLCQLLWWPHGATEGTPLSQCVGLSSSMWWQCRGHVWREDVHCQTQFWWVVSTWNLPKCEVAWIYFTS